MKKIFTVAGLLLMGHTLMAQNQRMALYEGFTSATCPPCAPTNASVDPKLESNNDKVLAVKYQTNIPANGDPMYAQDKPQIDARMQYYTINSNPSARVNGKNNYFSSGASSHPGNMTQDDLDRASGDSPFKIDALHTFSNAYDSIFVTLNITCSKDTTFTGGADKLRLHVMMLENLISFESAPASNGEKEFQDVMRKMYPTENGTVLPVTWTKDVPYAVVIKGKVPTYIYKLSQVYMGAFIQNNVDKSVLQAAKTEQQEYLNGAGIVNITNLKAMSCGTTVKPSYTIKNTADDNLTKATITYQLDNGTPGSVEWTGMLAPGAEQTVELPEIAAGEGIHTLLVKATNPNDQPKNDYRFDRATGTFSIVPATRPVNVNENFTTGGADLPSGWLLEDVAGDNIGWSKNTKTGAPGSKNGAMKLNFFNSPPDYEDALYIPALDLSSGGTGITFKLAYRPKSKASKDKLYVQASTDCGATWIDLYYKTGSQLANVTNLSSPEYTPSADGDWRTDTVSLAPVRGASQVLVRFLGVSGKSNNLYIDDVNVNDATLGVQANNTAFASVLVFPNPSQGAATLTVNAVNEVKATIRIVNTLGATVAVVPVNLVKGANTVALPTAELANGIYQVVGVSEDNSRFTEKLIISK